MPVISFASTKGGAGKSTSALILATELAEHADVIVIDADPRRPITKWSKVGGGPKRLTVVETGGERAIQDEIDEAASRVPFVIVDLEGNASRLADFAILESDLVIIPSKEQFQDADAAVETMKEVLRAGRGARREIPFSLVWTQTKAAVKSRTNRNTAENMRNTEGVNILPVEIVERDAYSSMFSLGKGIRQCSASEVNGLPKAIENAEAFTKAVVARLKENAEEGQS